MKKLYWFVLIAFLGIFLYGCADKPVEVEKKEEVNSEGITYKVRVVGDSDSSSSGQFKYFTGLSKISISDALEKATKQCKTHGQQQICKVFYVKLNIILCRYV